MTKSTPPFFRQEHDDTCALACLRMILAHHGTNVTEDELVQAATFESCGISTEEVKRLAERYGFQAEYGYLNLDAVAEFIAQGTFPIVFLDLRPIDGKDAFHTVIPIRVSRRSITFLDPQQGQRRVARRIFEQARSWWSDAALVCEPT